MSPGIVCRRNRIFAHITSIWALYFYTILIAHNCWDEVTEPGWMSRNAECTLVVCTLLCIGSTFPEFIDVIPLEMVSRRFRHSLVTLVKLYLPPIFLLRWSFFCSFFSMCSATELCELLLPRMFSSVILMKYPRTYIPWSLLRNSICLVCRRTDVCDV